MLEVIDTPFFVMWLIHNACLYENILCSINICIYVPKRIKKKKTRKKYRVALTWALAQSGSRRKSWVSLQPSFPQYYCSFDLSQTILFSFPIKTEIVLQSGELLFYLKKWFLVLVIYICSEIVKDCRYLLFTNCSSDFLFNAFNAVNFLI